MPSHQRSQEEAERMVEQLARVSTEISAEENYRRHSEAQVERFIKYAWSFGVIVASVACWQAKIQYDTGRHELDIARLESRVEILRDEKDKNLLLVSGMQTQINGLTRELEKRSDTVRRVDEMWWMKEHGISNKEALQQRTGTPSPNP